MHQPRRAGVVNAIILATCSALLVHPSAAQAPKHSRRATPEHTAAPPQETGFLNRTVTLQGIPYKFQIYLPEDFHRWDSQAAVANLSAAPGNSHWKANEPPPILLFLHGRGERGSEGLWQTQIGLPQQLRDHPERWPFIVVMPQCPLRHFWTDPEMLQMALAALDQTQREFHADPDRTYLSGISLGGYGAWELAREYPHRWAAIALVATGIFWSYAPDRWREASTLPQEYARRIGRVPIWLFHGAEDTTVVPRQSELMYEAFKANNGHIRLWDYQGLHHDAWTRAFNEPELPRWLLEHRLNAQGQPVHENPDHPEPQLPAFAERLVIPLHPPAMKLPVAVLDSYVGVYYDSSSVPVATIQRQGEQVFLKNAQGDILEIQPESASTFFYLTGSPTRLTFERDQQGKVTALQLRDDRHEELWEKRK